MDALAGSALDAWMNFCGDSSCVDQGTFGSCGFSQLFYSSTCTNHILVSSINVVLIIAFLLKFVCKVSSRSVSVHLYFSLPSLLRNISAVFSSLLGMVYLLLGLWMLASNLRIGTGIHPPHQWFVLLAQGFCLVLITLTLSIRHIQVGFTFIRIWLVGAACSIGFVCFSSILEVLVDNEVSFLGYVDLSSLVATVLLLFCVFKGSNQPDSYTSFNGTLYEPLKNETNASVENSDAEVTPFAYAGFFSKMSFWWLNPLMKKGYQKPLEENDIPKLGQVDQAGYCYSLFLEKLNSQKDRYGTVSPSILWTIVSCYRKEIILSGLFALLKILTLSSGPVLLNAFIKVSLGNKAFKHEDYVLAFGLFCAKCLESLSQRQWYFRTRRLGLQVRSLLSAAIYQKQLKLSNAAKLVHSSGEIMNYVTVDAYRIGEFPYWFHQTWTTTFQLFIALMILYNSVGLATISAMIVIVLTVACNAPLAKLQHKFQTKLMEAQDIRLKAVSEALVNVKVLKLYAWETHFKKIIEGLRETELKWLSAFQFRRAYNSFLFWSSPVLVSAATFTTCYFLHIPLNPSNVFTFVATLRLVQDPVRLIPEVIGTVIQANVAFARIVNFLHAPEINIKHIRKHTHLNADCPVVIQGGSFSWEESTLKPTLRNLNLVVKAKEKVAICGEVGSGKSSLLAAILGEIPKTEGKIQVSGKVAYVAQTAWIQTGSIQDNILFGLNMDKQRYQETLEKCSLMKDINMLPLGDLTEIGERGVNLSGGQKQRIQLARALYQDADIYLLDDPFSAVDAHTASSLFNEYVMVGLAEKTVILVTHQVDFLLVFDSIMLMSDGEVLSSASYDELLTSCKEFEDLVIAHRDTIGPRKLERVAFQTQSKTSVREINSSHNEKKNEMEKPSEVHQLIKREEKERGDTGLKPYIQYLNQNKGYLYVSLAGLCHLIFVVGQVSQNSWMAASVQNSQISTLHLITVYLAIGFGTVVFLLGRSVFVVTLGLQSSRSLFLLLLNSLFRAPMSFFDSTPLGRILSRVSSDLSIVDLDVPFAFFFSMSATMNCFSNLGVLAAVTWPVLFISLPMIYLTIRLQRYYLASAKELMRINGTTKSLVANHLSESLTGSTTIRAFSEEDRFFSKSLELIDKNASPFFHNFAASEWLIQRLETMSAVVVSSSALIMALLPPGTFSPGFIGMALSYGLSLNVSLVFSIQNQCILANNIISVERLDQYMHITSEAAETVEDNKPPVDWPVIGRVEIYDLKIRYRKEAPLVLCGISCTFEGGKKIGIVGRTGSGKTTLIGALFRLVEPEGGKITIDDIDITTIGLHDLRSCLGIIPQDPTLFHGSVRYNLDPLGQYTDQHIWEVLDKCQLREVVQEKEGGLDSLVVEDGLNWSMGQRQLFCLGRALLRRSRILVLDEATASIDNATDAILQKTIRTEFADCTVITVAHRIPTVMDCDMVLAISDGNLVEFDEPMKLMKTEASLFGKLVKEYWTQASDASI
ncbi:ABC transporter C family member 10-like isoform X1 [Zingiber officinale]|uniref:ABC transporter C family member 10-like isoform X1 n=1 Tax=Zingiber officinale TaxID=94328 RepID=UPI001C4AAED1|nr:ABC transporter C family member 10-like isoform X1 [Zingiber officinale]XP_042456214.1 ABC transporter C family member 10-like isoform X1 [Zingiber officinale]